MLDVVIVHVPPLIWLKILDHHALMIDNVNNKLARRQKIKIKTNIFNWEEWFVTLYISAS